MTFRTYIHTEPGLPPTTWRGGFPPGTPAPPPTPPDGIPFPTEDGALWELESTGRRYVGKVTYGGHPHGTWTVMYWVSKVPS